MTTKEQRKNLRVDSHNLLSYVCVDENNREVGQGMGRTLNVSEGGILMETHTLIDPEYPIVFTIAMEDDLMNIRGKIAFNKQREDGKYETGIKFIETDEETIRFIKQFVVIFKEEMSDLST
ncbi:MAG: PilZ domain-containing protein [Deltaproteobacteria bacterium]|nr:PilZ domain-containing protein [Deltaproteobacteria bacterium]